MSFEGNSITWMEKCNISKRLKSHKELQPETCQVSPMKIKKIHLVWFLLTMASTQSAQTLQTHKAVIFKKSSAFCVPCGSWGWELQPQVEADNRGNALIFQVQIAPSSDLYNSAGEELLNAFNDCNYYPAWFVDGKNKTVVSGSGVYPGLTREAIKNSADSIRNLSPVAGVNVSVQPGSTTLTCTITTIFHADTSGTFHVGALLVDKQVGSYQNGIGDNALHINVLRGALGGSAFGQQVASGQIRKNDSFTNTFTKPLISGEEAANQSLAIILWKKEGTDYSFVNAHHQELTVTSARIPEGLPSKIRVVPNPASEWIFIELGGEPFREATAALTDLHGKTVAVKKLEKSGNSFNINGYAKGIYFLKLVVDGKQEIRKIRID